MIVISKLMNIGGTQSGACVISAIQSCLTLCDPMDSLPGSSVHRIFQARILGCVAIPSSEDLPDPGSKPTLLCLLNSQVVDSLPWSHLGNPETGYSGIMYWWFFLVVTFV